MRGSDIMKNKIVLFICILSLSAGARAQSAAVSQVPASLAPVPRFHRCYYAFGGGAAFPFGGHWGDADAGFKPASAFTFAGARKVDDTLSYGLEASYGPGHKNRNVKGMKLRVFSFTPFLRAAYGGEDKTFYGLVGAGVYHWTQPALSAGGSDFSSDSGSSLGFNMGGGVIYPFWSEVKLAVDLRWHHIFSIQGDNLDMGSANNLVPSLFLLYGF
jgi:opacity protein-like surface antigen